MMEFLNVQDSMLLYYHSKYLAGQIEYIISCLVPKKIILRQYTVSLHYREFLPIEKITEEEKKELVRECNATGLKFTNKTLTDAARILYTLKKISHA